MNKTAFYFVQNICSWPYKCSFYILLIFSWCLHVKHFVVSCEFKGLISGNHSLLREISFISDENKYDIFVAVIFDIFDPFTDTFKSLLSGEIENYQCSSWWSVIWACDGSELLLSGSIPDLEFDDFIVNWYVFRSILYSDGILMIGLEVTINKSADKAGFPNSCITYKNELEWVIEFVLWDSVIVIVHDYVWVFVGYCLVFCE